MQNASAKSLRVRLIGPVLTRVAKIVPQARSSLSDDVQRDRDGARGVRFQRHVLALVCAGADASRQFGHRRAAPIWERGLRAPMEMRPPSTGAALAAIGQIRFNVRGLGNPDLDR